jgi:hypothetical protein
MMVGSENWRLGYLILFIVMLVVGVVNYILLLRMERSTEREFSNSR